MCCVQEKYLHVACSYYFLAKSCDSYEHKQIPWGSCSRMVSRHSEAQNRSVSFTEKRTPLFFPDGSCSFTDQLCHSIFRLYWGLNNNRPSILSPSQCHIPPHKHSLHHGYYGFAVVCRTCKQLCWKKEQFLTYCLLSSSKRLWGN